MVEFNPSKWQSWGSAPPAGGEGPRCDQCAWSQWIELCGGAAVDVYRPNIDVKTSPNVDIVKDLSDGVLPFHDEHASKIKMIHGINHIRYHAAMSILRECYRVLRSDGTLFLMVSDFVFVVQRIVEDGPIDFWLNCIYHGKGEGDDLDVHYWGYDKETLTKTLYDIGFRGVLDRGYMNRWEFKLEAVK